MKYSLNSFLGLITFLVLKLWLQPKFLFLSFEESEEGIDMKNDQSTGYGCGIYASQDSFYIPEEISQRGETNLPKCLIVEIYMWLTPMNWNITFISKLYRKLKLDNMTDPYGAPHANILSEMLINRVFI